MEQRVSQNQDLATVLAENENTILKSWVTLQLDASNSRGLIKETELHAQSANFLSVLLEAVNTGESFEQAGGAWDEVRTFLSALSRSRAQQGFSPAETASFVVSLKEPFFDALRNKVGANNKQLVVEILTATQMLDKLSIFTFEAYQRSREQVIQRQQQELLELSTPVVELWDGILALPLIGTLDSERTQTVMESLLEGIVEHEATIAIIDITGVPTVDTLVAQHLLKTVAAARLMGAECIISGIRPQIAQTIVHLGVELGDVVTKSSLAEALRIALRKSGLTVVSAAGR
jgi:rsbT co-antagonist protein RsbR